MAHAAPNASAPGDGAHSGPVPNAKSRRGMGRYPQRAVSDVSNPASGTTLRYSMRMIGSTYGAYRSATRVAMEAYEIELPRRHVVQIGAIILLVPRRRSRQKIMPGNRSANREGRVG